MQPRNVAVARLSGDICTKAKRTRQQFQSRLKSNMKDALNRARVDYSMRLTEARIDIDSGDPALCELASRVFGVSSVTHGRAYPWGSLDDIVRLGREEFADSVAGRRFAVRTRRSGHAKTSVPFKSPDVDRALGAALVEAGGKVDLTAPDVTARVDVRHDDVIFYTGELAGPSGLPIGVEGRGLALVSGGFDSAVAAWKMMSRGVELDFLFFNLGGPPHEQGVLDLLRPFTDRWCYGSRPELIRVDLRAVVGEMKSKVPGRYWQVLLKRLFLRAADQIAREGDYQVLVTGDALGQVSSQTLHNLAAVSAPVETLILRPLVGFDKDDIVNLSRVVGTHDLSARNPEYCNLDAGKPATRCSAADLDAQEALMDLGILERLVADRVSERVERIADLADVDVRAHHVPDGAVVLDLRDEGAASDWDYPGAVHMPFERAIDNAMLLPKSASYLLFCDVGLKSAFLAEQMRANGWDAHSFAGGVSALRRWASRR